MHKVEIIVNTKIFGLIHYLKLNLNFKLLKREGLQAIDKYILVEN